MPKKIIYSPYAYFCLKEIALNIAQDSETRAESFIHKIIDKIEILSNFPELGILTKYGLRKLVVHKNYKVIYEIVDNYINILYVANVKMNDKKGDHKIKN